MKPVKTKDSNVRLIHPEEEHLPDDKRVGDVPMERLFFRDPETQEQRPGFESTWKPTAGEQRALVNGAPIVVQAWGIHHQPIKLIVGEPPDDDHLERLLNVEEARRAAGRFFDRLAVRMNEETKIQADEIPAMFNLALEEVMKGRDDKPSLNGHG